MIMSDIYVAGHKNPDTDSIVAALAYAGLRNSLGSRNYKPVRLGGINDETRNILNRFGVEPPELIRNMRTQVLDLDFDHPPELTSSVTLDLAWRTMRNSEIASMPIMNEDGTLYGVISAGDIASYDMKAVYNSEIEDLPLFNLLSVLEGRIVNEFSCHINSISGKVVIALPSAFEAVESCSGIIICGNQPETVEKAAAAGAECIILCQAEINPDWAKLDKPCIISTPLDARTVSRVIFQAMPVHSICNTKDIVSFHLTDYLDDVSEIMLKSRYRCYPVLDENEHVVGTLSRYHLLRPRRKKLVLVDHNESSQSVNGLDQAEILEIIDHHRLGDIQTKQPVAVRNEPVGSTNTIITSMYQELGIVPSPNMAGLMAAAILSDTVLFKSPTCTEKDRIMAERLARIANISLDDLAKELFMPIGADKKAADLIKADYKAFHISGQTLGISQITCINSEDIVSRRDEFFEQMEKMHNENLDFVITMITDVLLEGSHLLFIGNEEVIAQAFSCSPKNGHVFLPQIMSRKKQIVPMLTALWG